MIIVFDHCHRHVLEVVTFLLFQSYTFTLYYAYFVFKCSWSSVQISSDSFDICPWFLTQWMSEYGLLQFPLHPLCKLYISDQYKYLHLICSAFCFLMDGLTMYAIDTEALNFTFYCPSWVWTSGTFLGVSLSIIIHDNSSSLSVSSSSCLHVSSIISSLWLSPSNSLMVLSLRSCSDNDIFLISSYCNICTPLPIGLLFYENLLFSKLAVLYGWSAATHEYKFLRREKSNEAYSFEFCLKSVPYTSSWGQALGDSNFGSHNCSEVPLSSKGWSVLVSEKTFMKSSRLFE